MKKNKFLVGIMPSIFSVIIGLFIGWFLMLLTNPVDSVSGIFTILKGGFIDGSEGIGRVIYTAIPIIMTGLAVGFSFKTGLFNIGASGQFTVGAFCAILVGVKLNMLPPFLHCAAAIFAGVLAGALWGTLSGALKAYFRVSEVITGIMLNYIGMLVVNLLIKTYVYDSTFNRTANVADSAVLKRGFLEWLLPGSGINVGFVIVIIVVILIKILLDKTTFGYELKTIGKNRFAGLYAGINDKKSIVLSMAISGALAGLGGALMYLSDFNDHIVVVDTVLQQGFTGICVALLGMSNPIGVFVSGLFIAHLTVGGNYLQLYSFTPEIVEMIIAVIIYCSSLTVVIKNFLSERSKKRLVLKAERWAANEYIIFHCSTNHVFCHSSYDSGIGRYVFGAKRSCKYSS